MRACFALLVLPALAIQADLSHARTLLAPVNSGFGVRHDPFDGRARRHSGVDFSARFGAPVFAAASGRVIFAGHRGGYGLAIDIAHPDGTSARYAHLSALAVRAGDLVSAATLIGRVGSSGRSTGPHLHFEYRIAGAAVDPLPYFTHSAATASAARPVTASSAQPARGVHRSAFSIQQCQAARADPAGSGAAADRLRWCAD